jgi:hypothetical protein
MDQSPLLGNREGPCGRGTEPPDLVLAPSMPRCDLTKVSENQARRVDRIVSRPADRHDAKTRIENRLQYLGTENHRIVASEETLNRTGVESSNEVMIVIAEEGWVNLHEQPNLYP